MTTFTTQDREDAEREPIPFAGWIQHSDDTVTKAKSLVEQAPYQPGYEDAVPQASRPIAELAQADILHILQNSESVLLGERIWVDETEYVKLSKIIKYAVKWAREKASEK